MPRMVPCIVRCSILQASSAVSATDPLPRQQQPLVEKHGSLIREVAKQGAQIAWQFYCNRMPDLRGPLVAS